MLMYIHVDLVIFTFFFSSGERREESEVEVQFLTVQLPVLEDTTVLAIGCALTECLVRVRYQREDLLCGRLKWKASYSC